MKKLLSSGYFLIIFSSLALSFKAVLVKVGYGLGVDAMTLMLMRLYVAMPLFMAALLLMEGRDVLKVSVADLVLFAFMGIAGMGCAMVASFLSLELIDASVNMVLTFTYPAITVLIMAVFGGERVSFSRIFSLCATFSGLIFVVGPGNIGLSSLAGHEGTGAALALVSAFCYALYNTIGQKVMKRISPVRVSGYCMFFLVAFYGGILGVRPYPVGLDVWGVAALLGVFCGFLPFMALLYGIRAIGASRAAIVSSFGPVFTAFWAYLLLGERLDQVQLAGMGLVIFGVLTLKMNLPISFIAGTGEEIGRKLEEMSMKKVRRRRTFALVCISEREEGKG